MTDLYQAVKVEEYHKSLKQNVSLPSHPTHVTTQTNPSLLLVCLPQFRATEADDLLNHFRTQDQNLVRIHRPSRTPNSSADAVAAA